MSIFPGFRALSALKPELKNPKEYSVRLECRQKKRLVTHYDKRVSMLSNEWCSTSQIYLSKSENRVNLCTTNPEEPEFIYR